MIPPSEIDPTDPWLRESQTFPELPPEMVRRVAAYGEEEEFAEDTLLFERAQRSIDFFLLTAGGIEIFATSARSGRSTLYTYRPGQFSGELNLFNSRQVLLSGLAKAGTRVVRLKNADFRKVISGEPDIGEIVMRAFILRRVGFSRTIWDFPSGYPARGWRGVRISRRSRSSSRRSTHFSIPSLSEDKGLTAGGMNGVTDGKGPVPPGRAGPALSSGLDPVRRPQPLMKARTSALKVSARVSARP
jgi:hypothetical protein